MLGWVAMFDFNRPLISFVPFENLVFMYSLKIRKKNGFPACLVDVFLATRIFANRHFFLVGLSFAIKSFIFNNKHVLDCTIRIFLPSLNSMKVPRDLECRNY